MAAAEQELSLSSVPCQCCRCCQGGAPQTCCRYLARPPTHPSTTRILCHPRLQAKDTWEMEPAEKLEAAAALKEKGNAAFKAGQYSRAVGQYDKALQCVE